MTASILTKTWTNKASAQKAFSRAGLDKASFTIAECNGEFCILENETEEPAPAKPAKREHKVTASANLTELAGSFPAAIDPLAQMPAPVKIIEPIPTLSPDEALAKLRAPRPENATNLPTPPDFSKPSHAPYRKRLAAMVAMAEAGDDVGLAALTFKVERSSQKIMARYRDACLKALGR